MFLEYIKIYWAKKIPEGGHQPATRVEGAPYPLGVPLSLWAPWQASGAHLLLYGVFYPEKIKKKPSGWSVAVLRRNLGRTNLGLRRSCSAGETSLRKGGNHHHRSSHREGVNLHKHLHQHHLPSNRSSSLLFDLGPKTSDWYLWVASSVDYSL